MATFKIEIDPKVLQVHEWAAHLVPASTQFPRLHKIADGSCKFYFSSTYYMWLPPQQTTELLAQIVESAEIPSAPNLQLSEGFLLRLVAISNNSNLAKELV